MKKQSMKPVLLIVEDDEVIRNTLAEVFTKKGFKSFAVERGQDAINFVKTNKVDIALLDLRLPDMNGLNVLKSMHGEDEDIYVIVVTAYPEVKTAISAMKAGAFDYINKPFELEELKLLVDKALDEKRLRSEVELLRYQKADRCDYLEMVGTSKGLREVKKLVSTVARSPRTPVLIRGETGTGKDLIAKAVHCLSSRNKGPFIKLNCSAIPDTLLETEMFGYEKGAFTDAKQSKKGLFELADGGTIFLDEIGDMEMRLQPKLLQVLENQTFRKIGGVRDIQVDVRVIAATNRDLEAMVGEKKFRADLYYRLNVMVITAPPLRHRKDDVTPLSEFFIAQNTRSLREGPRRLSPECRDILVRYDWPGNVRELKNIIERAMILADSGDILPEHLPSELVEGTARSTAPGQQSFGDISIEELEKAHILNVLREVKGNKTHASKILGISRLTLREKLKRYGVAGDLKQGRKDAKEATPAK